MSLKSHGLEPIPEETRRLMQRLCPKGTMVTQLRDALGPIYSDEHFAHLFPTRGRPAEAPWRLALVTVLQAIEGLTDRQAADAVRTRIDWLYALALPLDEPGFDYSILTDFRQRVLLREQVGQDVAQLLTDIAEPQTPQAVRELAEVALLRQIFAQHYEQQGQQVHWRDGPAVSNEERIVSPYDQEARSSRKRDTVWLGYKSHVTETCEEDPNALHLIVHVETTPATTEDHEVLAPLLDQERQRGRAPEEMYVDMGYTSGPLLDQQASLGTRMVGPVAASSR